jgi:hypothetical protein
LAVLLLSTTITRLVLLSTDSLLSLPGSFTRLYCKALRVRLFYGRCAGVVVQAGNWQATDRRAERKEVSHKEEQKWRGLFRAQLRYLFLPRHFSLLSKISVLKWRDEPSPKSNQATPHHESISTASI